MVVPRCGRTSEIVEPMLTDQWYVAMTQAGAGGASVLSEQSNMDLCRAAVERRRSEPAHRGEGKVIRARELDHHLQPVAGKHPGLVHLAPALVGPPHPGVVRRRRQRLRRARRNRERRRWRTRSEPLVQDEDVLDTWFSSALWPSRRWTGPADSGNEQPVLGLYLPSRARYGLRHHLLLGRAHGHDDQALHRQGALPRRCTSTGSCGTPKARR